MLPYTLNGLAGLFHSLQLSQFTAFSPACATPDTASTSASPSFLNIAILSFPGLIGIGGSYSSCTLATPPGMRVRTGRFEMLRLAEPGKS